MSKFQSLMHSEALDGVVFAVEPQAPNLCCFCPLLVSASGTRRAVLLRRHPFRWFSCIQGGLPYSCIAFSDLEIKVHPDLPS